MSSPEKAYKQHLKDTIGYEGKHRSLENIDIEQISFGVGALGNYGHEHQTTVRRMLSRELGISLDAFIGEHGAVDDVLLENTARYAIRSAQRVHRRKGHYHFVYVRERSHQNYI